MALLPIAWRIGSEIRPNNRKIDYNYPVYKDLGTVFETNFTLKLHLKKQGRRKRDDSSPQTITVELERFITLKEMFIQGSVSLNEEVTFKRLALKVFHHAFKENEKSFLFEINYTRKSHLYQIFCDLNLHGHISIDTINTKDSASELPKTFFCTDSERHKELVNLSTDLHKLLEKPCHSDVTLKSDAINLHAHRSILSSRSPVFRAMFENETTKEFQTGEVDIPDVSPETLHIMLNYIYSGKAEGLTDTVSCELLYAADKYQLLELKNICVSYLKTAICDANVFSILSVSELLDESLKLDVFDYIGDHFSALEKTDEWKTLKEKQPTLVVNILTHVVKFVK